MDLKGKVVVITGASSGVGRATTREFASRGAKLGLLARGEQGLKGARADSEELGAEVVEVVTDVSDYAQVEHAATLVEEQLGPIDVWINNAMVSVFGPVKKLKPEEIKRVTDVTYLGVVNGTLAALKRMLPRNRGKIIQVGSALAYRGIPLQAPYCGAKHAIQGFNESLRCELLHDGGLVTTTMVQLPALNTPQFNVVRSYLNRHPQPVPPIYQPELAAKAISWAATHDRREVALAASSVLTIGVNKFFPGILDRYLAKTGYESQQTDEPVEPERPGNLFFPLETDQGAHGIFGNQAHQHSLQWLFRSHPFLILGGILGASAAVLAKKRL